MSRHHVVGTFLSFCGAAALGLSQTAIAQSNPGIRQAPNAAQRALTASGTPQIDPNSPPAVLARTLQSNPITAPYRIRISVDKGNVVLSGKVGTKRVHDEVVRTAIALGIPVRDDLVIDTLETHRVAAFQQAAAAAAAASATAGAPPSAAAAMPSLGSMPYTLGNLPYVYPPPLFGRLDDPFFGFEPPLVSYPPWWQAVAARDAINLPQPTDQPQAQPNGPANPQGTSNGPIGAQGLTNTIPALSGLVNGPIVPPQGLYNGPLGPQAGFATGPMGPQGFAGGQQGFSNGAQVPQGFANGAGGQQGFANGPQGFAGGQQGFANGPQVPQGFGNGPGAPQGAGNDPAAGADRNPPRDSIPLALGPNAQDPVIEMTLNPQGQAVLRGTVPTLADRVAIGQKLAQLPGISEVVNLLNVAKANTGPVGELPPPPPQPAPIPQNNRPPVAPAPAPPIDAPQPSPNREPEQAPRRPALKVDNGGISDRIEQAFARRPALAKLPIKVSFDDGTVTLSGNVPTVYEAMLAYRAVQQTPGVSAVIDRLEFVVPDGEKKNPLRDKGRPEDVEPYLAAQIRRQVGDVAHIDQVRLRGDALEIRGTLVRAEDQPRLLAILRSMAILRDFRLEPTFVVD